MNKKEVIDLIKLIDRCYTTDYAGDGDIVNDWYKVLKNYELKDISLTLENYMKNYTQYPPKVYDLIKGNRTIENKKVLENAQTRCIFCSKVLDYGNETNHIDRCRSIEFIQSAIRRFKKQEIDKERYKNMSEEEFNKYYILAVKLVVNNTTNELEKRTWQKYIETLK